jgi:hypothetical protein
VDSRKARSICMTCGIRLTDRRGTSWNPEQSFDPAMRTPSSCSRIACGSWPVWMALSTTTSGVARGLAAPSGRKMIFNRPGLQLRDLKYKLVSCGPRKMRLRSIKPLLIRRYPTWGRAGRIRYRNDPQSQTCGTGRIRLL